MKRLWILLGLCVAFCGCDDEDNTQKYEDFYIFGDLSEADRTQLPVSAVKSIDAAGLYPSDMAMDGDDVLIVDSGNNAINRLNLEDLSLEKAYIDLGQNASPYAVWVDSENLYVALQGTTKTVQSYSRANPDEMTTLEADWIAPTAVISNQDAIFVADSEYDYTAPTDSKSGKIYRFDKSGDVTATMTTTAQNPGFLDLIEVNGENYLIAVDAGIITFGETTVPPKTSCVDFWKLSTLSQEMTAPVATYCLENASLGRTAVVDQTLYIGDALRPVVHTLSLDSLKTDRREMGEIAILEGETLGLTTPLNVADTLVVFNYNDSTMTWFGGDETLRIRLTPSSEVYKGPIDALYDAVRRQIVILNSGSGSLDILSTQTQKTKN